MIALSKERVHSLGEELASNTTTHTHTHTPLKTEAKGEISYPNVLYGVRNSGLSFLRQLNQMPLNIQILATTPLTISISTKQTPN